MEAWRARVVAGAYTRHAKQSAQQTVNAQPTGDETAADENKSNYHKWIGWHGNYNRASGHYHSP